MNRSLLISLDNRLDNNSLRHLIHRQGRLQQRPTVRAILRTTKAGGGSGSSTPAHCSRRRKRLVHTIALAHTTILGRTSGRLTCHT